MAYENKTIDYVYNLLIQSFQDRFNQKLRLLPKSFVVVLAKVLAGVFVIPYKLAGWFYLQLFPDTASFDTVEVLGQTVRPLVRLGNLFGVGEPLGGTAWSGTASVNVVLAGKTLTIGTQLKSDKTGLVYNVAANTPVEGDSVTFPVYCTQSGTGGALSDGDALKFVSPLGFVSREATVTGTTENGTDEETEAHYRARVQSGYGPQPQGGSLTDYRTWAFDVAGVLNTYPYNDKNSPAGVLLYVAGSPEIYPDRIPDRGLCVAVGKACTYDPDTGKASRKPLTAVLDPAADETYANVMPVAVKTFDVYVTGLDGAGSGDFGDSVAGALKTYFENREPYIRGLTDDIGRTDEVLRNAVIAVVSGVATSMQAKFGTATMQLNGVEMEGYTLGQGELAALGSLYVDGVKHE